MSSGWPPGKSEVKPQSIREAAAAPAESKPAVPSPRAERRPPFTDSAK